MFDLLDIDVNLDEHAFSYNRLIELVIPIERYSQDKIRPNKYGCKLFELRERCYIYR